MSNVAPSPPQAPPAEASSPATLVLRIVLLVILALLIGAIFVDRKSGEESNAVYESVRDLSTSAGFEQKMPNRDDVEKLVGFPPAGPPQPYGEKGDKVYEEYHWRRGLPFLSNVLYVIYSKGKGPDNKDKLSLSTAHYNNLPAEDDTSDLQPPTVTPSTGDTPPTPPGPPPPGPPPPRPGATDPAPGEPGTSEPSTPEPGTSGPSPMPGESAPAPAEAPPPSDASGENQ